MSHSIRRCAIGVTLALALVAPSAQGAPLTAGPLVGASTGPSPFEPAVGACAAVPLGPGPGTNYPATEPEPYVAADPANPLRMVGAHHQDRWSNGAARNSGSAYSSDGGATWTRLQVPAGTVCSASGPYDRASDPWVSFSPNGVAHFMSLVADSDAPDGDAGDNGMSYNRGTFDAAGNLTWSTPTFLIEDADPRFFNDKNSITADPNDQAYVYAVWDRLGGSVGAIKARVSRGIKAGLGLGFTGPAWFARSTDNGLNWEDARQIYLPSANNQTIGNQIGVLPDGAGPAATRGDVLNVFNEIVNFKNSDKGSQFEFNLSLIRSTDHGATWADKAVRIAKFYPMDRFREDGVIDTEPADCPDNNDEGACPVRTGDILFDIAVDQANGNLYAVVQDARFGGLAYDTIAFTMSTDGGRTWSALKRINPGSDTGARLDDRQAFTPSVHVGADGSVAVTFYDFRANTATDGMLRTDYWAVHCHASCGADGDGDGVADNWTETALTGEEFDMRLAPFARGYFTGDYEGLTFSGDGPGGIQDAFVAFFNIANPDDPFAAKGSVFSSRLTP